MSWTTVMKANSGPLRMSLMREETVPHMSPVTLMAKDPPLYRSSLCLLLENSPGDAQTFKKYLLWKCRKMELLS